ncbi:MAG TPA: TA system VapC family ribonuclease toxin [Candidatus Sulfomarinibacteraceae bacterium]|nr:TA system VapC family ribonuclease toxin [Candidatus Sulfomarinibacteraceae bacterium]
MTDALPDVNVLLALAWPNHQFHRPARRWFAGHDGAWCTCALTQLGFVRLSSNPAFTDQAKLPAEATRVLAEMTRHSRHRFIAELVALDTTEFTAAAGRLLGHQQVTDAYLVALAQRHGVRLVTFDRRVEAIAGDRRGVTTLAP